MRTLIIDGDLFCFEASSSVERTVEWETGQFVLHADLSPAKAHFDSRVNKLQEDLEADEVVVALSEYTDPWRKKVMPSYKEHRKETRKPMCYMPLREYVSETRKVYSKPGLEGDDIMGILGTHPSLLKGEKVMISADKDMLTIPGVHLKLNRMRPGPVADSLFTVTRPQADYQHLLMSLTGDPTDGFAGVPGIGPKKGAAILAPFMIEALGAVTFDVPSAWEAVVNTYQKNGLSADDALMNARVARICRASDWDFKRKEVKLWNPE